MKHFFLNALLAFLYIVGVASLMFSIEGVLGPKEDTFLAPIAFLSLFVLSAAVMGFLFLYRPAMLYLEDRKKEALEFFGKTLATFALLTVIVFVLLFFVV